MIRPSPHARSGKSTSSMARSWTSSSPRVWWGSPPPATQPALPESEAAMMLGYYFALALASLRRNVGLTPLMIAAIAVGIGASMIVLVVYRAEAGDPIPDKAHQLYAVQLDNWGPERHMASSSQRGDDLEDQLSYADALALMRAHAAKRQAAMFATAMTVVPENAQLSPFT